MLIEKEELRRQEGDGVLICSQCDCLRRGRELCMCGLAVAPSGIWGNRTGRWWFVWGNWHYHLPTAIKHSISP